MRVFGVVFPGQGSQSVGMLDAFAQQDSGVMQLIETASHALGFDLWKLVHEGPSEQLNETEFTQVALLTADVAMYRALQKACAFQPSLMAGHSLGEYAALVCAEAITFEEALLLVRNRGRLMQEAVPLGVGEMAAIVGLTDEQVEHLCREASQSESVVSPANYNAIGQVVVAGHRAAVDRVLLLAEQAQARLAKKIPVSVPCHCDLLRVASEAFAVPLSQAHFQTPQYPVMSNVLAQPYASAEVIPKLLQQQLYAPVRWVDTIQYMRQQGVDHFIECGPGQVLSGLIKRIDRGVLTSSVYDVASLEKLKGIIQ
jgi:[acyl-carrier-protein] S-malonyltransferase